MHAKHIAYYKVLQRTYWRHEEVPLAFMAETQLGVVKLGRDCFTHTSQRQPHLQFLLATLFDHTHIAYW